MAISIYPLQRLAFLTSTALLCSLQVSATVVEIDLGRKPDYGQLATLDRAEKLSSFHKTLGDALAVNWRASKSGRPGASTQEGFARWVDLYQWIDLLQSDESVLMKQWLSRHLHVEEQQTTHGKSLQITLYPPGGPLNETPNAPEVLDKLLADDPAISQIVGKLVAQPYSLQHGSLADQLDPKFIAATLADPDFLRRWSESFSPDDVTPKVLLNLQSIWESHRDDWRDFQALALALAVVKDQPAPDYWPHHQVAPSDVPRQENPPEELFGQWVQAAKTGKLRTDLKSLEVSDLKFVIDAPLKFTEFASIQGNPQLAYLNPPKAFESIAYDQGRVIKNVYDWPWGWYLLNAIKFHGGICVDQAYYASIAGKALGIPTILFCGQGKDGGHSWVGFMKGAKQWDLNVARYASQNYGTGEGLDPQTWTPITDHDLELLTRYLGNRDNLNAARRDLVIATDFRRKGDLVNEGCALQSALQISPENPAVWDAREEWLMRSGASTADLKAHHQAAIGQFARFNNLKAQHEQALIKLALRTGEKEGAESLAEQIVNENRKGASRDAQSDIGAQATWLMLSSRLQGKDFTGAIEQFEHQLHLLGQNGGGDFFYGVVSPLTMQLSKAGRQVEALRVVKESYQTLKPARDSILDRDIHLLWVQVGGAPAVTPR